MKRIFTIFAVIGLMLFNTSNVKANEVHPHFDISLSKPQVQNGETFRIDVDWSIYQAKPGQEFKFKLPEQVRNHSQPIELINEDEKAIAVSHRDGDYIVFTFNELVDGLTDLKGDFWIETLILYDKDSGYHTEILEFEVNGEIIQKGIIVEVPEYGEGINDRDLIKYGTYDENDDNIIHWVVEVNGHEKMTGETIITDTIGHGHKLIIDSIQVNRQIGRDYEYHPHEIIEADENGYVVEIRDIAGTIVITYQTQVSEKYIDHKNHVHVYNKNSGEYGQGAVAIYYDSGGTGSGVKPPVDETPEEPIPETPEKPTPERPVGETPEKPVEPVKPEEPNVEEPNDPEEPVGTPEDNEEEAPEKEDEENIKPDSEPSPSAPSKTENDSNFFSDTKTEEEQKGFIPPNTGVTTQPIAFFGISVAALAALLRALRD